jgi:hypothetical protein
LAANEYTPQDALDVLMGALRRRNEQLAIHIQSVVDAGKDVYEDESFGVRRRNKKRSYRRTVQYDYEEALQVAIHALQAYFVEQPLFIDSCTRNMTSTRIDTSQSFRSRWYAANEQPEERGAESKELPRKIEIELKTETQISESNEEVFDLQPRDPAQIDSQRENISKLKELLTFEV